jgi:hypothetical protein
MSTAPQRTCAACGTELSGAMKFCPVCMLHQALGREGESNDSSFEEAVKSTPEVTQRFEHYELVKGEDGKPIELGRGAMGVTYKAFDVHFNVASVFHLGRSGQTYFYAMEFVEGETLASLILRSGRLEVKLALEIAMQVAAGLAAVHKENLVHRDIKPSNIMVNWEDGVLRTAKIIDLGLAKTVGDGTSESAISVTGGFAGTPEFAR